MKKSGQKSQAMYKLGDYLYNFRANSVVDSLVSVICAVFLLGEKNCNSIPRFHRRVSLLCIYTLVLDRKGFQCVNVVIP